MREYVESLRVFLSDEKLRLMRHGLVFQSVRHDSRLVSLTLWTCYEVLSLMAQMLSVGTNATKGIQTSRLDNGCDYLT
jgi:hypothetical protein